MGEEYEIIDRYGRRTGQRARRVGGGGGDDCLSGLVGIGIVVIALIFGAPWLYNSLIGWIQSNALPVHDSLKNIQVSDKYKEGVHSDSEGVHSDSEGVHSDSEGLHVISTGYWYSSVNYGDVDVSVTAKLLSYRGAQAAYGLMFLGGLRFTITNDGKWFYNNGIETPSTAIKQGVGVTNILEVNLHGQHFTFFVNGVRVGEWDYSSTATPGSIGFIAGPTDQVSGDTSGTCINYDEIPSCKVSGNAEAVFTDFTITKDG